MLVTSYIGFGSNLGDLMANFENAKERLGQVPGVRLLRTSPLYRSEPQTLHNEKQAFYLNAIFEIQTSLSPHDLLHHLKEIEKQLGRPTKKSKKWQPRIADLDIVLYGDVIYQDAELEIPHKEMVKRKFVLKPLCDLIADQMHPQFQMTIQELLEYTKDNLHIELLS